MRKKVWHGFLIAVLITSMFTWIKTPEAYASGTAYHVSVDGDDVNGDGSETNPYATVEKAKQVIRNEIVNGMTEDITVYIRGGNYYVTNPIVFDESDSGRDGYTITYTNYPGETPVFHGGEPVTGWTLDAGNVYKANVGTSWNFNTLYEEDQRAVKARTPNGDYLNVNYLNVEETVTASPKTQFKYASGDLPSLQDESDLEVYVWPGGDDGTHNWFADIRKVTDVDRTQRIVTLQSEVQYNMGAGSRYYFRNAKEFLDQPGEYYLDSDAGYLYYRPYDETVDIDTLHIVAPKVLKVFEFAGSSDTSPVSDITLSGLKVTATDQRYGSALSDMDGTIHLQNTENITVERSEIANTGSNAFYLLGYNQSITIRDNWIHGIGNTGIQVKGTGITDESVTAHHTFTNNHIHHTGVTIGHGAGIQVMYGSHIDITHNRIHHTSRYSISLNGLPKNNYLIGETVNGTLITEQNYRDFMTTHSNLVAYNDVSHANLDSQDTGPIQAWGSGPDNVIRNNSVHDSDIAFSFGFGIYLDDAVEGFTVENNILHHLQRGGTEGRLGSPIFAKGTNNTIRNNIVADSNSKGGYVQTFAMADEENVDIDIERNLFTNHTDFTDFIYTFNNWSDDRYRHVDRNLFFNSSGMYKIDKRNNTTDPAADNLLEWKYVMNGAFDQFSVRKDPLFMDAAIRDYRPRYNSPAYTIGFKDFNIQDIGLTAAYPFANREEALSRVFVKSAEDAVNRSYIDLGTIQSVNLEVTARTESGFVADVTESEVTFTSEQPHIASVDDSGVVTAHSDGVAEITAQVTKNGITKSQAIHVIVGDSYREIQIRSNHEVMQSGNRAKLQVLAVKESGRKQDITDQAVFTSSDPSVASIQNHAGLIAGTVGTSMIQTSVTLAGIDYTASTTVEVQDKVLEEIQVSLSSEVMMAGETATASLNGVMSDGTVADLTDAEVVWSVDSESAEITGDGLNAVIQADEQGTYQIYAQVLLEGVSVLGGKALQVFHGGELPAGWSMINMGNAIEGYATFDNGEFTLISNGENPYGQSDKASFVYKEMDAPTDGSIVIVEAKIDSYTNAQAGASAGIMIRDGVAADAKFYFLGTKPTGSILITYRNAYSATKSPPAGSYYALGPNLPFPMELRLVMKDQTVTPYYKDANNQWQKIDAVQQIETSQARLAGGILTGSGTDEMLSMARFSEVKAEQRNFDFVNITATADKQNIDTSEEAQITVHGETEDGIVDIVDSGLSFTSSNPEVASVDEDGTVTGIQSGDTVITVVYGDGDSALHASIPIIVIAPVLKDAYSTIFNSSNLEDYGLLGSYSWGFASTREGSWIQYADVDFGSQAYDKIRFVVEAAVNDDYAGADVEVRLDTLDGPLLGTATIESTGGFGTYREFAGIIDGASGIHDVFIVFANKPTTSGNIRDFKFVVSEDLAAPLTTDDAPEGWVNHDAIVTLTAEDNESGVDQTFYKVNDGEVQTGTSVTLTEGSHTLTYWSRDNAGNEEPKKTISVKIDKTAPTLEVTASPDRLWPPNRKLVEIETDVAASDEASGIDTVVLTSIENNEADDGSDDIQNAETGTLDQQFDLRAERSGQGSGRIYAVTYKATDKAGNETETVVEVIVPHDASEQ